MLLGKLDSYVQKNEIRTLPNAIHKDKLKMDYKTKCKIRNYKTLRGKHRQNFQDINQSKIFYDPPPRVMEIKTKVSNWDLTKLKSFCTAKEMLSMGKRRPSEWEKIIASETADSREPAHKIPPMTRSRGENLTGKADQVFRDSEKLPPVFTLKMISVFLMPASIDYSLISVT